MSVSFKGIDKPLLNKAFIGYSYALSDPVIEQRTKKEMNCSVPENHVRFWVPTLRKGLIFLSLKWGPQFCSLVRPAFEPLFEA